MESKFESSVREIAYSQQVVYNSLSNLNNLERVKDRLPENKIQDFTFDEDSMAVNVAPVGKIAMRIVEREEPKCIKFESEKSPLPFNFWIQLLPVTETTCKLRITIKADVNPLMRAMVSKPLTEAVEKIADVLANIPYE